jgi:hypothetical protein
MVDAIVVVYAGYDFGELELLPADRGLVHQTALRHGEHRHAFTVGPGRCRLFLPPPVAASSHPEFRRWRSLRP